MRIRKPIISKRITHLTSKRNWGFFFFPFIFMDRPEPNIRHSDYSTWIRLVNHESIHFYQCLKLLVVPWILIYFGHYLINLIKYKDGDLAYRNVVFEREAYCKDDNLRTLPNGRVTAISFVQFFDKEFEYKRIP